MGLQQNEKHSNFVIAASEPQSREVRIIKGIAGRARNDEVLVINLNMLQGLFCNSP